MCFSSQYWVPTMCLSVLGSEGAEKSTWQHPMSGRQNLLCLSCIYSCKTEKKCIICLLGVGFNGRRESPLYLAIMGCGKYKVSACKLVLRWAWRPAKLLNGRAAADMPDGGPEGWKHKVVRLERWVEEEPAVLLGNVEEVWKQLGGEGLDSAGPRCRGEESGFMG